MKQPDSYLPSVTFRNDPDATRQLAGVIAKLNDMLRDIYARTQTIEVVSSAPATGEVSEHGDGKGKIISDIKIVDSATQTNRRIYYKFQGNLRYLESD